MTLFPNDLHKRVIIKSVATEAIVGHMSSRKIHSIEAGVLLIADGCDMTKGRARIPMSINTTPRVGDIHKYSANAISTKASVNLSKLISKCQVMSAFSKLKKCCSKKLKQVRQNNLSNYTPVLLAKIENAIYKT